jgi:hypothetical protein
MTTTIQQKYSKCCVDYQKIFDFLSVANNLVLESCFACTVQDNLLDWYTYLRIRRITIVHNFAAAYPIDAFQELLENCKNLFDNIKLDKHACLLVYDPNFFFEYFPSYGFTQDGEMLLVFNDYYPNFTDLHKSFGFPLIQSFWNIESFSDKDNIIMNKQYWNNKRHGILDPIESSFINNLITPSISLESVFSFANPNENMNLVENSIVNIMNLLCIPVNSIFVPYSSKTLLYYSIILDTSSFPKFTTLIDCILANGNYNLQLGNLKQISTVSENDTGFFYYTSNQNLICLLK